MQFRNKTSLFLHSILLFLAHTYTSATSTWPPLSSFYLLLPRAQLYLCLWPLLSALPLSPLCLPLCQHQLLLAAPSSEATFATPHTSPSGKSSPDEAAAGTLMKLGSAVLQGEGVPSPVTALSRRGQLTGHRHPCVVCATISAVVQSCRPSFFTLLLTVSPLVCALFFFTDSLCTGFVQPGYPSHVGCSFSSALTVWSSLPRAKTALFSALTTARIVFSFDLI